MGGLREIDHSAQPVLQCFGRIGGHRFGPCFVGLDDNLEAKWAAYSQQSIDPKGGLADGKADTWAIVDVDLCYLITET